MKTYLDCVPCFFRQALEAARLVSDDAAFHEMMLREVLSWAPDLDYSRPPPVMGQRIHRHLRKIAGVKDPYEKAKKRLNRMAASILPSLEEDLRSAEDPLDLAVRLAIAGNVLDMGVHGDISEEALREAVRCVVVEPLRGDVAEFRDAVANAREILYLGDNAGEIMFDRLLIEQIGPERVTLAVRGAPVINDATLADAEEAGLHEIVEIIDNGSDAPGTLLSDCGETFRERFSRADLILAKGQGNFETLSEEPYPIFFLFKAKCPVIANHVGFPIGTHVLARPRGETPGGTP